MADEERPAVLKPWEVEAPLTGRGAVIATLCEASKRIGPVPKDAEMRGTAGKDDGYKYRSIRAIMALAQTVFYDLGIVLLPERIIERKAEPYQTKYGSTWIATDSVFEWSINIRTGDYILIQTVGEARDGGDKGSNKVQTASYKYALIAALSLAEGHADSDDERPEEQASAAQVEAQAKQAQESAEAEEADRKARFKAALDAWSEVARSLSDDEKAAVHDACERDGEVSPRTKAAEFPRSIDIYETWRKYGEQAIASRARDAPTSEPTPEPEPEPEPAAESAVQPPLSEVVQEMAARRDGAAAGLGPVNDAMAERLAAVAAQDAATEPEVDDEPEVDPHETGDDAEGTTDPVPPVIPPRSQWKTKHCFTCKSDVKGYAGMPCPMPECDGTLEDSF